MHNHRMVLAVCGFLVLAVVLVFGQTVRHGFVNFDDDEYVYGNPRIRSGLTAQGIAWAFTHSHAANWHPMTWLSHMLDCQIYGLKPWGHHLTNVVLHAATAVLLFLVLRQMTGQLGPSALAAAVFAIHPLRAESVAWVAERKDVLSGLFFMATLAAYVGFVRRPFSLTRYLLVVVLFALGLMAKPMLVTLPFVLLLLDYWPLGRFPGESVCDGDRAGALRLLVEKIPLLLLAVASCVATLLAQRAAIQSIDKISFHSRVANAMVSYVAYLGQFFCPSGLAAFYPYPEGGPPAWKVAAAVLLLMGISGGALFFRRRCPALAVGWLWYLGTLLPVIGLVQVGSQSMADRYTYLTQIGLGIALFWGLADVCRSWPDRRWLYGIGSALVLVVLAADAWRQTSTWVDSETLWTHALTCTARNDVAHNNLGNALFHNGRGSEAAVQYQAALKIKPDYAEAHNNLGFILQERGRLAEAIDQYRKCLEIDPDCVDALNNLGFVLAQSGRVAEAIDYCQKALAIEPEYAAAHVNYAVALYQQGKAGEAIAHWQRALELDPEQTKAHSNLGLVLQEQGRVDEAIDHCRKALELNPGFVEAHNNLANALGRKGRLDEAIEQYRKAVELKPDFAEARFNLGITLDQQGKIPEALAQWREVARLRPNDAALMSLIARLRAARGDAAPADSVTRPPTTPSRTDRP